MSKLGFNVKNILRTILGTEHAAISGNPNPRPKKRFCGMGFLKKPNYNSQKEY
jgi:hypothetical protein